MTITSIIWQILNEAPGFAWQAYTFPVITSSPKNGHFIDWAEVCFHFMKTRIELYLHLLQGFPRQLHSCESQTHLFQQYYLQLKNVRLNT